MQRDPVDCWFEAVLSSNAIDPFNMIFIEKIERDTDSIRSLLDGDLTDINGCRFQCGFELFRIFSQIPSHIPAWRVWLINIPCNELNGTSDQDIAVSNYDEIVFTHPLGGSLGIL